jgi:hypothetical protein
MIADAHTRPDLRRAALVDVGLLHPGTHRGLGQMEITRNAPDRVPGLANQRDDLGLELLGERRPRSFIASVMARRAARQPVVATAVRQPTPLHRVAVMHDTLRK